MCRYISLIKKKKISGESLPPLIITNVIMIAHNLQVSPLYTTKLFLIFQEIIYEITPLIEGSFYGWLICFKLWIKLIKTIYINTYQLYWHDLLATHRIFYGVIFIQLLTINILFKMSNLECHNELAYIYVNMYRKFDIKMTRHLKSYLYLIKFMYNIFISYDIWVWIYNWWFLY